jgi:uncharacterized protein YqgQ
MITPQHPWNVLPTLPIGDANTSTLFQSVGYALTQWEIMEVELSRLFGALLRSPPRWTSARSTLSSTPLARASGAERAYGMIVGFGGRADMIEAAAETVLYRHRLRATVKGLIDEIGNFSPRRNEIAHGIVMHVSDGKVNRNHYLCPNYTNAKKVSYASDRAEWKYMYTAEQIDQYAEHFAKLARATRKIILEVSERLPSYP